MSFSLLVNPAFAIDNPDSKNFIRALESREAIYLSAINDTRKSTKEYLVAYENYVNFLDRELEKAYRLAHSKLTPLRQQDLLRSQRHWKAFRSAEFELINNNWNRQNFGSSAGVSRGNYRSTVIKNRVLQLLHYANNY